jgi:hypothetical protein
MSILDEHIFGDLNKIHSLDELADSLKNLLNSGCYVWDDELINSKQLVDRIKNLKIEIYLDEHSPPHFHVKSANINASFVISDCERLNGDINRRDEELIKYWYRKFRLRLIKVWNNMRPSDCPVGQISDVFGSEV